MTEKMKFYDRKYFFLDEITLYQGKDLVTLLLPCFELNTLFVGSNYLGSWEIF